MAFTKELSKVPASIGTILVYLKDVPAIKDQDAFQTIDYQIDILDADGSRIATRQGDLESNLTSNQITQLKSLLTALRTKVTTEILP